jgi:hypothetical protein
VVHEDNLEKTLKQGLYGDDIESVLKDFPEFAGPDVIDVTDLDLASGGGHP